MPIDRDATRDHAWRAVRAASPAGVAGPRHARLTFLGHSTVRVDLDGVSVLTDPMLGHMGAGAIRRQVEAVGELLHDAGGRVQARLEQIDRSVDSAVEQVELLGGAVKSAATRPARELSGLAAGISAAVGALVHGRKYPVDQTTQDEEMFI